jgi:hypothetical protein
VAAAATGVTYAPRVVSKTVATATSANPRARSRERYSRPRAEVEAELQARYRTGSNGVSAPLEAAAMIGIEDCGASSEAGIEDSHDLYQTLARYCVIAITNKLVYW